MLEKIDLEIIKSNNDVLLMLDDILEKRDNEWWDKFYTDKSRPISFFKILPDENLSVYVKSGIFNKGKVLDIGCGNGRNSIYLSKEGLDVQGIDFSSNSIEWAIENASENQVDVKFICKSIFDCEFEPNSFDYIYDSGCLHHIKPHRREQYLKIVSTLLKPNGHFGLVCFNLKGGANISDYDVYRNYSMGGGIGFSEYKLRAILEPYFTIVEFREMKKITDNNFYGEDFLWSVLMKRK